MPQFQKIYLAADHAGFAQKEAVKSWLQEEGFVVTDCGAQTYDDQDDFPEYMQLAAAAVQDSEGAACALLFGGSGQGEAMAANRYTGVRATVFYGGDPAIITLSREHNNANVLSLGSRFVSDADAKAVIWDWLHTAPLSDDKYHRRNQQLDE